MLTCPAGAFAYNVAPAVRAGDRFALVRNVLEQ